jgi:hypothetical protein
MLKFLACAGAAWLASSFAAPVQAMDNGVCPAGLICASNPDGVKAAFAAEGVAVKVESDERGNPLFIAANTYEYEVHFLGCSTPRTCDALQFVVFIDKQPGFTPAFVSDWNMRSRFIRLALTPEGDLVGVMDVATTGGLNAANFATNIYWWNMMSKGIGIALESWSKSGS